MVKAVIVDVMLDKASVLEWAKVSASRRCDEQDEHLELVRAAGPGRLCQH